jgi:hypothetical protein
MRVNRELIAPIGIIAASAFLLHTTAGFKSPHAQSEIFGPAFFPQATLLGLIAVSLVQAIRALINQRADLLHDTVSAPLEWVRFVAALTASVGYVALMKLTGFLPATLVFQAILLFVVFGWRDMRMVLGVPAGLTLLYFIIFVRLLDLPLPQGYGWFRQFSRVLYF